LVFVFWVGGGVFPAPKPSPERKAEQAAQSQGDHLQERKGVGKLKKARFNKDKVGKRGWCQNCQHERRKRNPSATWEKRDPLSSKRGPGSEKRS